jgi:protein-S-isoprenylcysteine O-methyltransferase Ste14
VLLPARWRVRLGYVAGALALALACPTAEWVGAGLVLGLLGEALRLWASGHIEKTQRLATGGPYAHTQSPLYLGSTLMAVGFVLASSSPWVALAVGAYFLLFYPSVIREEAAFLAAKFPEQHPAWAAAVPRFIPRISPAGPAASRFEWRRVSLNKEWRTCLALPLVFGLLLLRARLGCW